MKYEVVDLSSVAVGAEALEYGAHDFRGWYRALRDKVELGDANVLAFAPGRPTRWCNDAHSMGFMMDRATFICIESPEASPNLVIHKLFHTFGFFHQQARNKQYRLLNWELGLPGFAYDDDEIAGPRREGYQQISFFSPMALAALGMPSPRIDGDCHFSGAPGCLQGDSPWECADVAGPACRDADGDGIVDLGDGYPLSSPRRGDDSDHDGTPDILDLCPDNELQVRGDLDGGPMNYWAERPGPISVVVNAPKVVIESVGWTPPSSSVEKVLGDYIFFEDVREQSSAGSTITIPAQSGQPIRLRVSYRYRGRLWRRSMYVYTKTGRTSPTPWAYINEKEWYYFNRFGCDPPANLDFYDVAEYDADADGLPDRSVTAFDPKVLGAYDWDDDGTPDSQDTLPTVAGTCSDHWVRGVKDSDGDGMCDIGALWYGPLPTSVDRHSYFGEFMIRMDNDPDADRCPYLSGPAETMGCPRRRDGLDWYAEAFPFEEENAVSNP
jgi:hypothetical protein